MGSTSSHQMKSNPGRGRFCARRSLISALRKRSGARTGWRFEAQDKERRAVRATRGYYQAKGAVDYARPMQGDRALSVLVGGHLDTVSFVMDYVEFRIGYGILRAHAGPRVELHDETVAQFPDPGSRDALCRLIDSTVVSAREADGAMRIEVWTDRGDLLVIDGNEYPHPEFAQLVPANERGKLEVSQMYIW